MKVREVARYVRSKNAGPFWMTIDVFCETEDAFALLCASDTLKEESISELYGVPKSNVKRFIIPSLRVIKLSFPRPVPQGSRHERDMHGGQQYILLAEVEV